MKNRIIYLLTTLLLLNLACSRQEEDSQKKKVDSANTVIDKQVSSFNPGYMNDPNKIHYALKVEYDHSIFNLVPNFVEIRPGNLPYSKNEGMPFVVSFTDKDGKEIGNYAIEDPRVLRSCDNGDKPSTIKTPKGSFELLIPGKKEIYKINIITKDKESARFEIDLSRLLDSLNNIKKR